MNCATIQKSISAYLDRELPTWEKGPIGIHLDQCPSCHRELQKLITLKSEMRGYSMPAMPQDLKDAIEAKTIHAFSNKNWLQHRWLAPTLIFTAAAASWLFLRASKMYMQTHAVPPMVTAPAEQKRVVVKAGRLVAVDRKEF